MVRIVIAGVVGGLVVFCWGAVTHMVLPLGMAGVGYEKLETEDAVLAALKAGLPRSGMYFVPGMDSSIENEQQRMEAVEAKSAHGSAMVIYHSTGGPRMGGRLLAIEYLTNMLCALIAALVLADSRARYGVRVLLVTLLGLFAWLEVEGSYWNWYGFPDAYTGAQGVIAVSGWLLAGLVIAAFVPGRRSEATAQPASVAGAVR
jgi:multisubunit Na+/H+ antiporter MnhF subunit